MTFLSFFIPLCYCQFSDFSVSSFDCLVDALVIIGLPDGPTAHFKLSKLVLRKDIKVCCPCLNIDTCPLVDAIM